MNDLLQFNSRRSFSLLIGVAQGDEADHFDVFRDLKNLFHLWFVKGTDPASSKAKACGHRHHISSCQGGIVSAIFSLSGIETEDEDDRCLFHMGRFDKEESGHLPDPFSRLRICDHDEVPGLEVCPGREPISLPQGSEGEDLAEWVCPDRSEWTVGILISLGYPL